MLFPWPGSIYLLMGRCGLFTITVVIFTSTITDVAVCIYRIMGKEQSLSNLRKLHSNLSIVLFPFFLQSDTSA